MLSLEELRSIRSKRRLTLEEKQAYTDHWKISKQSQRLFCEQEALPLSTFSSWLKTLSCKEVKEEDVSFVAVEVSPPLGKPSVVLGLQLTLPNGIVIEGAFSLSDVSYWIEEFSHGLTPLR